MCICSCLSLRQTDQEPRSQPIQEGSSICAKVVKIALDIFILIVSFTLLNPPLALFVSVALIVVNHLFICREPSAEPPASPQQLEPVLRNQPVSHSSENPTPERVHGSGQRLDLAGAHSTPARVEAERRRSLSRVSPAAALTGGSHRTLQPNSLQTPGASTPSTSTRQAAPSPIRRASSSSSSSSATPVRQPTNASPSMLAELRNHPLFRSQQPASETVSMAPVSDEQQTTPTSTAAQVDRPPPAVPIAARDHESTIASTTEPMRPAASPPAAVPTARPLSTAGATRRTQQRRSSGITSRPPPPPPPPRTPSSSVNRTRVTRATSAPSPLFERITLARLQASLTNQDSQTTEGRTSSNGPDADELEI